MEITEQNIKQIIKKTYFSRVPGLVVDRGLTIAEAIKVAADEERELLSELIVNETDRSKKLRKDMSRVVWNTVHAQEIIKSN